MNKKGFYNQIILIAVLILLFALIIGGFTLFSIIQPVLKDASGSFTDAFRSINTITPSTDVGGNLTEATQVSTEVLDNTMLIGDWLGYVALFVLMFGFFIIAYNVKAHPVLAIIWIFAIVAMTIVSFIISNAYTNVSTGELNALYLANPTNDFIMRYLPYIIIGLGVIGGLILLTISNRQLENEVTYV